MRVWSRWVWIVIERVLLSRICLLTMLASSLRALVLRDLGVTLFTWYRSYDTAYIDSIRERIEQDSTTLGCLS